MSTYLVCNNVMQNLDLIPNLAETFEMFWINIKPVYTCVNLCIQSLF